MGLFIYYFVRMNCFLEFSGGRVGWSGMGLDFSEFSGGVGFGFLVGVGFGLVGSGVGFGLSMVRIVGSVGRANCCLRFYTCPWVGFWDKRRL